MIVRYKYAILKTYQYCSLPKNWTLSRNCEFITCNADFITRNCEFITCNADFITRNFEFITCNADFITRNCEFISYNADFITSNFEVTIVTEYVPFRYFTYTDTVQWEPVQSHRAMTGNDSKPRLTWE